MVRWLFNCVVHLVIFIWWVFNSFFSGLFRILKDDHKNRFLELRISSPPRGQRKLQASPNTYWPFASGSACFLLSLKLAASGKSNSVSVLADTVCTICTIQTISTIHTIRTIRSIADTIRISTISVAAVSPPDPCIACCNLLTNCQHNSLPDIRPGHNYSAIYLMAKPFLVVGAGKRGATESQLLVKFSKLKFALHCS